MTQSDPRGVHDWHSGAYVEEWISAYTNDDRAGALRRLVQLIPFDPDQTIRVLDIGGGWGPVTSAVLESYPHARVTLHDFSDAMLEQASQRLAPHGDAVSFVRGDLMSPTWKAEIDGQFDAIVSSLAIHNVRFPDRIRAVYQEIFPLVAPGGCFLNLDQAGMRPRSNGATRHAQAMERRRLTHQETGQWRPLDDLAPASNVRGGLDAHARPSNADLQRMAASEPATLANQLRWLLDAGFDEADCFSRDRGSALMGAFRA